MIEQLLNFSFNVFVVIGLVCIWTMLLTPIGVGIYYFIKAVKARKRFQQ